MDLKTYLEELMNNNRVTLGHDNKTYHITLFSGVDKSGHYRPKIRYEADSLENAVLNAYHNINGEEIPRLGYPINKGWNLRKNN